MEYKATDLIIAGLVLLVLGWFVYTIVYSKKSNVVPVSNNAEEYPLHVVGEQFNEGHPIEENNNPAYLPNKDFSPPESDWLRKKFEGRNRAQGDYRNSSFNEGIRGNLGPSDWDQYFDHNNNIIANSQSGDNDQFQPFVETSDTHAIFRMKNKPPCGSNQNCEPEDMFDADKYLPQEVNDDWFEVQPEPISVKNRHLINITKPIGINTIGTSLRNASWDIRGAPSCPKFVVSPWLQSSIEPDTNLKPLY